MFFVERSVKPFTDIAFSASMPVDHLRVTFKPSGFFTANPALDVPGGIDPKSVNAFGGEGSSSSCCSN